MFEDVTLSWKDESFTVPAEGQMVLIAKIEAALQGDSWRQPLGILMRLDGPSYGELARAYGAALRHAGAAVSDSEVYLSIQEDLASLSPDDVTAKIQSSVVALITIMSPPLGHKLFGGGDGKKSQKAGSD